MMIDIQCSCCGRHRKLSNKKVKYTTDAIENGWGSCGSALYCPECTRAWKKRNGDRPMADDRHTFFVIMGLFMDAIKEAQP